MVCPLICTFLDSEPHLSWILDYFGYAQLDIIDIELKTIYETIRDHDWNEAYILLEALTTFFTYGRCTWPSELSIPPYRLI